MDGVIRKSGCGNGDAPTENVHHIPFLVALKMRGFSLLITFDDGNNNINATLGPSVSDDDSTKSRVKVDADVPFTRVAKIAAALTRSERSVFDVG
ncbi:hypothetical protein CH063_13368 [Colletotrichum higginsianum]|uniref:Uncharacterized protein n=1 Tax=Colletotrichum higginsianum (strain IMI 349063) TaxID=759273 RepID=H1VU56_COLHI|nr:hypothetical protein CH063_13368 [Colletotrichum higginsianum]